MRHPDTSALDRSRDTALALVRSTGRTLRRTRGAPVPLSQVRSAFRAAEDALDAAVVVTRAGAQVTDRPLLRELLAARDHLLLQRHDTSGLDLPHCAQTRTLDADGLHAAGLRPDPRGARELHGLDLTASLAPGGPDDTSGAGLRS